MANVDIAAPGASEVALRAALGAQSVYPTMIKPVDASFAWINQGGASVTTNANGGLFLRAPAGAGVNLRVRKKSAPVGNYTLTAAMIFSVFDIDTQIAGLCLRQSSDGKIVTFEVARDASATRHLIIGNFTNATTFSANVTSRLGLGWGGPGVLFLRIQDNGTNRLYSYSHDGYNFIQLYSETRTTFLTADELGFFAYDANATYDCGVTLLSWDVV